jgi:hypothetical protein
MVTRTAVNRPVVPGKKATGTGGRGTSAVAMTTLVTSLIMTMPPRWASAVLVDVPLDVFDDHDRIVDHQPSQA